VDASAGLRLGLPTTGGWDAGETKRIFAALGADGSRSAGLGVPAGAKSGRERS